MKWSALLHPTLYKAQVTSLAATVVDFGTLAIWTKVLHLHYPWGVSLGAALGAITNVTLNRHWAFNAGHAPVGRQVARYFVVSFGSLVLNTALVFGVTEIFDVDVMISKVVVSLVVGFAYNYPLHRFYVYRG